MDLSRHVGDILTSSQTRFKKLVCLLIRNDNFLPEKVRTWREKKHWASEAGEEHKPLKKAFLDRQNLNSGESLTMRKKRECQLEN